MDAAEIGRRIREARTARGISQGQLATMLGRTQTAISYWESGTRSLRVEELADIATALNIDTADLLKERHDSCVFCAIIRGHAPAEYVHSWPDAIAIVPLAPVTPGHVIVIPRVHVGHFTTDPDVTMRTMARAAMLARKMEPAGDWNLITSKGKHATQTIRHLHVHLVPRRAGDGLALPWTGQETTDAR